MKPKISIITVSYNSEEHIEEAIQSVIKQDYVNKEYIIVDGASTDQTMRIVEKYRAFINVIISEPDSGISDAFNKGIRAASGDVICIVNSDDIMPEEALSRFASQYEEGIDVFRGEEIIRNFETGSERLMKPTMDYRTPVNFNVCHMATYIRREAFERFGYYDESFRFSMDRELLFRFHRQGAKEKRLEGVFGLFRLGGVSQTINKRKTYEALEVLKRNGATKTAVLRYYVVLHAKSVVKRILANHMGDKL